MDFLAPIAQLYYPIYWFIVLLMTINHFQMVSKTGKYNIMEKMYSYRPIVLFSIFFVIFYGLRPVVYGLGIYFGDTNNYAGVYEQLKYTGDFMENYGAADSDWLFYLIEKICSQIMDVHLWLLLMMVLYIVPMYEGCKRIDIRHGALLMLFCLGSFQFYPFAVNGVRNGIACSLIIYVAALLCDKKILFAAIISYLAIGFHKSAVLPAGAMFFTYFISKPKYMFITWFVAIVISLAVGEYIDNALTLLSYDERLANNLQNDDADGLILEHRFRWDFLLYSSMPIILAAYTIFKRKLYNKTYLILLGTYMYANSFWVLAIRAIFSNRIAYLSWFIYPIVLAYPLLNFPVFKHQHSKKTAMILLAHFGFTTVLWLLGK